MMKTRLRSARLYTVGWITVLPAGRAAAAALLDDQHEPPQGFNQRPSDPNSYTWGRMGAHNTVIAALPPGVYGLCSATATVCGLLASLPHIKTGLLVGTAGGIARPDTGHDIRLGDVVVSQPSETTSGVVHYDLGASTSSQEWEPRGSLNMPPPTLLSAMGSLQAEHILSPPRIPDLLETMRRADSHLSEEDGSVSGFEHPGLDHDRLFVSTHAHVGDGGSDCDGCDAGQQVPRPRRASIDPEIHYGVVASGNTLFRSAASRDSLAQTAGELVLCVEMEAAGLMNLLPCLVIRGICNYADSHKNDRWQRYASATAAAYAKELLHFLAPVPIFDPADIDLLTFGLDLSMFPSSMNARDRMRARDEIVRQIRQRAEGLDSGIAIADAALSSDEGCVSTELMTLEAVRSASNFDR